MICLAFYSCNNCKYVECDVPTASRISLRIVDKESGSDLVFDSDKRFNFSEINIIESTSKKPVSFINQDGEVSLSGLDSIILINALTLPKAIDIFHKDKKLETITLKYTTKSTECCGDLSDLSEALNSNGKNVQGIRPDIIIIMI